MPSKPGQIAPRLNDARRKPISPGEMAGQPKYKIGIRGKPFYLSSTGEWILSNRDITEVKRIIDFQGNPKRENYVWAKTEK